MDPCIDRDPLAGRQQHRRAGLDLRDRQIGPCAVGPLHHGASSRKAGEPLDRGAGLLAHEMVERAADQQKEQEHHGRIEIGLLPVMGGVVEAHAEGERHADEIGTSMFVRPCLSAAHAER